MEGDTRSSTPGPWLARRYAAKRALEQKLLQERARYARQANAAPTQRNRRGRAVEWNPFAVIFGILLGSWFGRR